MKEIEMKEIEITETLPVDLSDTELEAFRDLLAAKALEEIRLLDEKKDLTSSMGAIIKDVRHEMEHAAKCIRDKSEKRIVRVVEHNDLGSFTVSVIRQDTLQVVRTRPMIEEERQWPLPMVRKAEN